MEAARVGSLMGLPAQFSQKTKFFLKQAFTLRCHKCKRAAREELMPSLRENQYADGYTKVLNAHQRYILHCFKCSCLGRGIDSGLVLMTRHRGQILARWKGPN